MLKKSLLAMALLVAAMVPGTAAASATISIPIEEYERLKEHEEGDVKRQYWKMSFEQILEKENNNYSKAWERYEFWVLRKVYLNGPVTDSNINNVLSRLETLDRIEPGIPITLSVNSPGGAVFAGLRLVNAFDTFASAINTVCDSMALSMGAVIFAAGDTRIARPGCIFMIHDVGVGSPGGQTMEHVKWTENVIEVESRLVDILSQASGLSPSEIRTLMEYETFWNAEEMSRLGFADVIRTPSNDVEEIDIPDDLLPLNRMRKNFNEKLDK